MLLLLLLLVGEPSETKLRFGAGRVGDGVSVLGEGEERRGYKSLVKTKEDLAMPSMQVRVGVAAFIFRHRAEGTELLTGHRIGSHGHDTWSIPGGHIEYGETPEDCVRREVMEETGLEVGKVTPFGVPAYGNTVFEQEGKHYITLFFEAAYIGGEPRVCEPERMDCWIWRSVEALKHAAWEHRTVKLFRPLRELILNRPGVLEV